MSSPLEDGLRTPVYNNACSEAVMYFWRQCRFLGSGGLAAFSPLPACLWLQGQEGTAQGCPGWSQRGAVLCPRAQPAQSVNIPKAANS